MKLKATLAVAAVIILAGVIFAVTHNDSDNKTANSTTATTPIPVGSTTAVAKAHARQGVLPTCMAKDSAAETAVRADDYLINGKDSAFDLATTMGIIDVPAGTNVDVSIHKYDGKTASGSIAYPKQYGTYNFKIIPNTKAKPYHQWNMTSLVACK